MWEMQVWVVCAELKSAAHVYCKILCKANAHGARGGGKAGQTGANTERSKRA